MAQYRKCEEQPDYCGGCPVCTSSRCAKCCTEGNPGNLYRVCENNDTYCGGCAACEEDEDERCAEICNTAAKVTNLTTTTTGWGENQFRACDEHPTYCAGCPKCNLTKPERCADFCMVLAEESPNQYPACEYHEEYCAGCPFCNEDKKERCANFCDNKTGTTCEGADYSGPYSHFFCKGCLACQHYPNNICVANCTDLEMRMNATGAGQQRNDIIDRYGCKSATPFCCGCADNRWRDYPKGSLR